MIFNVNYSNFAKKLIPYFLRKPKFLALIESFMAPLQSLNFRFIEFRKSIEFKLAFNAQIIYLEQYLNTVHPNPGVYPNNIHVLDGANIEYFYVWNSVENQIPVYFYNHGETSDPVYLEQYAEQSGSVFNYVINIPAHVQNNTDIYGNNYSENIFKSRVNFYNLAGKTYELKYF
jgi:hypothetical protein